MVYFQQGFQVKEFKDSIEIALNDTFQYNEGNICYDYNFKCQKVEVTPQGNVDSTKVGTYHIYYTYTYKNKSLTKEQIVTVKDYEPPIINVDDNDFSICPNSAEANFKVKAYDNYDLDLSSQVKQYLEGNIVHFKVKDSSGNETEVTKELTYQDKIAPSLTLNGNAKIYLKLNEEYHEQGAKAIDNCEGDITKKVEIKGQVNSQIAGEYTITYSVKDNFSNTQKITRKVYVYPEYNYPSSTGKNIYLTFDDGPGPYTEKLLDILKKYNVKATFFVTNQNISKGYDNMILRAYNEGHTIGLHSDTHNYNIYQNADTYFADLYAIQAKVKRITGYTSTIIRFPGGSSNTVSRRYDNGTKIMSELTKAVEAKGFRYFDWNISSGDAGETTSTTQVFSNIIKGLGNNSTYVVLQHDIKKYSVNAVEDVIKYALSKGYTFKALTMESPTVHHHVNN